MTNEIGKYVYSSHPIGKGGFSIVYKGFNIETDQVVAIKKINIETIPPILLNKIEAEVKLLQSLYHPNIIKYYELIKSRDSYYIILEYCPGGDLHKKIARIGLSQELIKKYITQLASALKYLKTNCIMHRDIKPHNILLNANDDIILTDFNFAKEMEEFSLADTLCGSPLYMAPEIIKNSLEAGQGYTINADLWSIGVLMYEMIYGYNPFNRARDIRDINILTNSPISFPPTLQSDDCIDLVKRLLEKDMNKRIDWDDFFSHSFINSVPTLERKETLEKSEYIIYELPRLNTNINKDESARIHLSCVKDEFVQVIHKSLLYIHKIDLTTTEDSGIDMLNKCLKLIETDKINNISDITTKLEVSNSGLTIKDVEFMRDVLGLYHNYIVSENLDESEKFYSKYAIQKLDTVLPINQDTLSRDSVSSASSHRDSLRESLNLRGSRVSISEIENPIWIKGSGILVGKTKPIDIPKKIQTFEIDKQGEIVLTPNIFSIFPNPKTNRSLSDLIQKEDTIYHKEMIEKGKSNSYPKLKTAIKYISKSYGTIKELIGYISNSPKN